MERRQDYVENQISLLSRMLRRLLEKMMNVKSTEADVLSEQIAVFHTDEEAQQFTVKDLQAIEDSLLISFLTDTYGYTAEDVQMLADILYEMKIQDTNNSLWMHRKALLLYEYYMANTSGNIHLSVFLRIQELRQQLKAV